MTLALLLLACQAPFGADRHDLVGFRVAAVAASPAGGPPGAEVTARVAIVVDGRPWSDVPVGLAWRWLSADEDAATWSVADAAATGPRPTLVRPDGADRLGLVATAPDGSEARAYLALPETAPAQPPLAGVLLDVSSDGGRVAADAVAPGEVARAYATYTDVPDPLPVARWMATAGTFRERDASTADWYAADVRFDDDTATWGEPAAEGPVTFVVLATDGAGFTDCVARDVFVGDVPAGLFTAGGRFLPGDAAATGLVRATLLADDASPTGLRVEDAVAVEASALPDADPYGTAALPCTVAVDGPFDPGWLLDQRCTREQVAGATVVLEAR